jgi:hypothetical protein
MIIFADVDFYKNKYLLGRNPIIPLTEFNFWARKATERININKLEFEPDFEPPERLSMATCEVAEKIYSALQAQGTTNNPALSSEKVGNYSVTYADMSTVVDMIKSQIDGVVVDWLANTELHNDFVFRGVR